MLARNRTSLRFIQSTNLNSTLSQGEPLLGEGGHTDMVGQCSPFLGGSYQGLELPW